MTYIRHYIHLTTQFYGRNRQQHAGALYTPYSDFGSTAKRSSVQLQQYVTTCLYCTVLVSMINEMIRTIPITKRKENIGMQSREHHFFFHQNQVTRSHSSCDKYCQLMLVFLNCPLTLFWKHGIHEWLQNRLTALHILAGHLLSKKMILCLELKVL